MEQQLQEISEKQKASWNKFSPGWKKWDDVLMEFLKPMGEEIISLLNLKGTDHVLDIAAGTGEPGLSIALRVKDGKVVLTDLADGMLGIAREHAANRGIRNVEFLSCDVCALPFPDNTFDAISCRFGFMFFPDMLLAAKEIFRVLKPGGRIATSVWGAPEKNFWVTAMGGIIQKNMLLPEAPPDAPGMFRCAKSGFVESFLYQAGFKNISEKEVNGKLVCGSAEVYWTMTTEIAAPFVAALSKGDAATQEKIRGEVLSLINQKYPEGNIIIDGSSLVIYGEK